jgi:hypothetical protein
MRRLTAALVALIACEPAHAQNSWDLTKCRSSAPAGHLCTAEHLDTDLALLTAREIAKFLDPESQALELRIRRDPQTHIFNPEASLPDPRTDSTVIQLLHAWAESGLIESEATARQASASRIGSNRESLQRATATVALRGIKSISVTIEDSDSSDAKCRPTNDALRLAAIGPIVNGRIKVVSNQVASPALYVGVTALSISIDGCGAFLSVTLRDLPYPTPGYRQPPKVVGRKVLEDGSLLTSPRSEFTERVRDQLRRTVDGFVSQVKLANQMR